MKYIYGPVISRRLGASLGIDVIPHKTCTLDCLYCECGPTTNKTHIRSDYVNFDELTKELDYALKNYDFDYITFAGSGEPTLYKGLGKLITYLKEVSDKKVCVITNSTLLWLEDLRSELLAADIIIPSVDTVNEETFRKLNRNTDALQLTDILNGLKIFSEIYKGQLWIEILFVKGFNDTEEEVLLLKNYLTTVRYDRIEVHTVDRPPAYRNIKGVDADFLDFAGNILNARVIKRTPQEVSIKVELEDILSIIRRRPYTVDDIVSSLSADRDGALRAIYLLEKKRLIRKEVVNGQEFIVPVDRV